MESLTVTHWSILAFGALIMGMSKGGLPGAGNLTVAIYALVLEDALGLAGVPLSVGLLFSVLNESLEAILLHHDVVAVRGDRGDDAGLVLLFSLVRIGEVGWKWVL